MHDSDIKALRSLWVGNALNSTPMHTRGVKLWLMDGDSYVNNTPPLMSLHTTNPELYKDALSFDAFRFASNAAQTLKELEQSSAYSKVTSWRVIKTYYAAFFAAHATMRIFGRSFSSLSDAHAQHLANRCLTEAGYTPNLPSGYYLISINNKDISFKKYKSSHECFWTCYSDLCKFISLESLKLSHPKSKREDIQNYFDNISSALTNNGRKPKPNWLSNVRNDVNYSSEYGVWYPFNTKTPDHNNLFGTFRNWRSGNLSINSPHLVKNDIERFYHTAFSVIDIGMAFANDYKTLLKVDTNTSSIYKRLVENAA